jgi:DNA replication protein DnaC
MKEKQNFNCKSYIERMMDKHSHAVGNTRFHISKDTDTMKTILGLAYKSVVLERVNTPDEYRNLDEKMKQNISDTANWLCDPNKKPGLLFFGDVGTGKTTLLKAICNTINTMCERDTDDRGRRETTLDDFSCINLIKAKSIVNDYANPAMRPRYDLMSKVALLAIDELGVEPVESKLFGNTSEPIVDMLCERYDRQLCTIISTNLDDAEIKRRYGNRLADRFNEMFATIPFNGQSFRK